MSEFQFKISVIDLPVGTAAKYTGSNGNVVYLKSGQEAIVNGADTVNYAIDLLPESEIPVPIIEEPPVDEPADETAPEGEAQAEEKNDADVSTAAPTQEAESSSESDSIDEPKKGKKS